ncbi:SCO family protein [Bacillaceae bacterium W0354]
MQKKRTFTSILVVFMFSFIVYFIGTDGFTSYTAETARTNDLIEEQPMFPNVTLEDTNERTFQFSELEGKYVFITFFYSSCSTVCIQLEQNMSDVYDGLDEEYFEEDLVFLSISFDPDRDTPKVLDNYREYFGSDGDTWRIARINDKEELQNLLDAFQVIVIPDGNGHFTHNSAFYLVDPKGKLIDVMDYKKVDQAIKKLEDVI